MARECRVCRGPGELVLCRGCATAAHAGCFRAKGCPSEDCPLAGLAGGLFFPRNRAMKTALAMMVLFACAFVAALLRHDGQHLFAREMVWRIGTGALAAALALAVIGFASDLATPAGHCLWRERVAQVLAVLGLALILSTPLLPHAGPIFIAGIVVMLAGGALEYFTPERATRHPLRAFGASDAVVSILIVCVLAAIAVPNFKAPRTPDPTRSCYFTQKTIQLAVEMYSLDRNTRRAVLDQHFFEELRSGGYLQAIPVRHSYVDSRPGRWRLDGGTKISCEVHGSIE